MSVFQITLGDGTTRMVDAERVVSDDTTTRFEDRIAGQWLASLSLLTAEIRSLRERTRVIDGTWQWSRASFDDQLPAAQAC